jgi:hypothetical protein
MDRPWLALLGAAALCAGCGARTGLLDDGPSADADVDADPGDADGAFPCNYGRIGELAPIAPAIDHTYEPEIAWGDGRLAATFSTLDGAGQLVAFACTTGAAEGYVCAAPTSLGALDLMWAPGTRLTWDGEAFGACWLEDGHERIARFQRITPDGRPVWDTPAHLVGAEGPCRDLVWAGDRYLVALASNIGDPEHSTAVLTMDRLATVQEELLLVPAYLSANAPLELAADGAAAAATWLDAAGVHVRVLQGLDDAEVAFSGWPTGGHLGLALRGTEAGLLWAIEDAADFSLYLTRVDLVTGGVGDPIELGEGEGALTGADIVAVAEGYVIAWNAWNDDAQTTVVVPTRRGDGMGVEVRRSTTLFEGAMTGVTVDSGSPSLAYDGVDVYVATTVPRESDGQPEVRVQVLACHR